MMVDPIITYIIETEEGEYYCGKTKDIIKRINEHSKEKRPHWFGFKKRKKWKLIIYFDGDHEKKIKTFGIKRFMELRTSKILWQGGLPS